MIFTDVPPDYPNRDAIERVAASGILSGVPQPDGSRKFEPERPVTRRELAIILDRMNIAELMQGYPTTGTGADVPPADHADA